MWKTAISGGLGHGWPNPNSLEEGEGEEKDLFPISETWIWLKLNDLGTARFFNPTRFSILI